MNKLTKARLTGPYKHLFRANPGIEIQFELLLQRWGTSVAFAYLRVEAAAFGKAPNKLSSARLNPQNEYKKPSKKRSAEAKARHYQKRKAKRQEQRQERSKANAK